MTERVTLAGNDPEGHAFDGDEYYGDNAVVKEYYGAMEHTFDTIPFEADLNLGLNAHYNQAQIGDFIFTAKKPENY